MRCLPFVLALCGCGGSLVSEPEPLAPPPEPATTSEATAVEVTKPVVVIEPTVSTLSLTLETRSGIAREGWRFSPLERIAEAKAELTLSSWDCGARGRWVDLRGSAGLEFCVQPKAATLQDIDTNDANCVWTSSFEAGGSRVDVTGRGVLVRRGSERLGVLRIARHSILAERWYEEDPIAPFDVELEFLSTSSKH